MIVYLIYVKEKNGDSFVDSIWSTEELALKELQTFDGLSEFSAFIEPMSVDESDSSEDVIAAHDRLYNPEEDTEEE